MKIISHRGNLNGKNIELENTPNYIQSAINEGFDVEIDVWFVDGSCVLGHDAPIHQVVKLWIVSRCNYLWIHAKNKEAFYELGQERMHYFWHQTDHYTLTSKGIPWCYPKHYAKNGIAVIRGIDFPKEEVYGICTDYALTMNKKLLS